MKNQQPNTSKLIIEVLPIIIFFILYKFYDIIYATGGLLIATIAANIWAYVVNKKISVISLVSSGMLIFFAGITIYTADAKYIKIKVSAINLLFAIALLGGVAFKQGFAKYIYGEMLELSQEQWIKISLQLGLFFLSLAMLNELIWRNCSDALWIKFKVFGILPLSIAFSLWQLSPYMKNKQP